MKINIIHGDLFSVSCDAYVNPTDVNLSGSGGLDRLIHARGGLELEQQCARLRKDMEPGKVVMTGGGNLPVKYVLHTACPKCADEAGDSYDLLRECYLAIMLAASSMPDIHHLALPLVGTGIAGYSLSAPFYAGSPHSRTAVTILSAIARFPSEHIHARIPAEITIVCSSEDKFTLLQDTYRWIFGRGISKRERIRGALLGGALGDALGYPVEFKGTPESWLEDFILDSGTGKALISDDTQMTLYTACGLLWGCSRACMKGIGGDMWNYIAFAYDDWCKTQKLFYEKKKMAVSWIRNIPELNARRAPGTTCLSAVEAGCGSVDAPINDSKGCGGVMRIAPIPLYGAANRHWDQKYNATICAETAALTHGHPLGWLSAVALGNILFDIMQNFSLAYSVADTILFLKKNYEDYPDTERMTGLLSHAVVMANMSGYTSSYNLIAEFDITKELGEGWVGEEALAVGLFCVLATQGSGVKQCLQNAVGHRGDSDSTGSIAGQIWGAYFGERSLPEKWLRNLELRQVIAEIADDLTNDCKMSEYSPYYDPAWTRKYLSSDKSSHIPGPQEAPQHFFIQIPWKEEAASSCQVGGYTISVQDGKIYHISKSQEEAHKGSPGFGFTDLHYDAEREAYVESHGWVKMHAGRTVTGCYCNIPFTLLPNHASGTVEIFRETGPNPWIGTVRRRQDEWNNPVEIEFVHAKAGLMLGDLVGLLVMDRSFLRDVLS